MPKTPNKRTENKREERERNKEGRKGGRRIPREVKPRKKRLAERVSVLSRRQREKGVDIRVKKNMHKERIWKELYNLWKMIVISEKQLNCKSIDIGIREYKGKEDIHNTLYSNEIIIIMEISRAI